VSASVVLPLNHLHTMRAAVLSCSLAAGAAHQDCHSVSAAVPDSWCDTNCNFNPPSCPPAYCNCDVPTPSPSPTPSPPPVPPAPPSPPPAGGILGYWDKTWAAGSAPRGANLGVAFNGWADAGHALSDSAGVYNSLTGTKYISIGGGNANGRFSLALVQDLERRIKANAFSAWQGIALDIEECSETGLASAFQAVLAAAKGKGLETMVTVSHSAPYGCTDAHELMRVFLADGNTDYVSPQLYGPGTETSPDFSETINANVTWTQYVGMRPKLIPSIVDHTHYRPTIDFFTAAGIPVAGYVQWKTVSSALVV